MSDCHLSQQSLGVLFVKLRLLLIVIRVEIAGVVRIGGVVVTIEELRSKRTVRRPVVKILLLPSHSDEAAQHEQGDFHLVAL